MLGTALLPVHKTLAGSGCQQNQTPVSGCMLRCCVGTEAPEIADSILRHGWYEPNPASDVWSLGQLMINMVGADRPSAHTELYESEQYEEAVDDRLGPDKSAVVKAYYLYLQRLMPGHGNKITYAQQVRACHAVCTACQLLDAQMSDEALFVGSVTMSHTCRISAGAQATCTAISLLTNCTGQAKIATISNCC